MKRVILFSILIIAMSAVEVVSQVTISYEVAVTTASGPHASVFPSGEHGTISYTLDPAAVDSNADTSRGVYSNAVLSMSVSFPGLGIFANAGSAGLAQTFDNVGNTCTISDQVFFFGGPISSASTLGGETINQIEVDFLSEFRPPSSPPFMLSSDALPLSSLPMIDPFVIFRTAGGSTFVNFSPTFTGQIQLLKNEIEVLVAIGRLTRPQADRLLDKLNDATAALARGNTRGACADLRTFIDRVNAYIDEGSLLRHLGQSLIDDARDLRAQMGC